MLIRDQCAVITGSAKRIGGKIALAFAKEGCNIVLHYHKSDSEVRMLQESIINYGVSCRLWKQDLSLPLNTENKKDSAQDALKNASVLINSASIFHDDSMKTADQMFNLHYYWPAALSQILFNNSIIDNSNACIINITDAMLDKCYPNFSDYFASKSALRQLTKNLAKQYAPLVRTNAVAPGCILFPPTHSEKQKSSILKQIPLGKSGNPEDIANACVFLVKNNYINGVELKVDGGRSL